MPESMHMIMWIMSDRTIPRSLRFMEGFGVHTFRLVNAVGKSTFVKFHWKPKLGMQSMVWNEAVKINGADPDFHRRDLWNSIQSGDFPEWELGLQLFDEAFAKQFDFDVLDATKLIPEEILPIRIVGRLVFDRVVNNFFAETEQVAFCTSNIVPGIDFSNDPLLAGRNFSYLDTQLKRLGRPNFTHLPINALCSGEATLPPAYLVPLASALSKDVPLRSFPLAQLIEQIGAWHDMPHHDQSSNLFTSLTQSDGILDLPLAAGSYAAGDFVQVRPFASLL